MSSSGDVLTVNVRASDGSRFSITVGRSDVVNDGTSSGSLSSIKIFSLKNLIAAKSSVSSELQRLIFKGRVLQDDRTLEDYGFNDNETVHMVKGSSSSTPPSAAAPVAPTSATSNPSPSPSTAAAAAPANPFAAMMGGQMPGMPGAAPGAIPDVNQMQAQLMQNPEMMASIMDSPMMRGLLDNPETLRNLMTANPQMRDLLDRNPQLNAMLNDPSVMRQTMEAMRNPNAMAQMMRDNDLGMAQIENHPGGFNHLRRMYQDVQEPMMEAMASGMGGSGAGNSSSNASPSPPPATPQNTAMPNPWGAQPPAAGSAGAGATPWSGVGMPPMGGLPGAGGGGGGGIPGMPGMPAGMGDPNQMLQMLDNPMMQNMMRQMQSDPTMLANMMNNPMIRNMAAQNPQLSQMLNNPQMMQQAMDPNNLRAMLQMQQSMSQLQNSGLFGAGGAAGAGGGIPGAPVPAPAPPPGGLDFSSLFGAMGAGGAGVPSSSVPAQPAAPVVEPAVRFARQLTQMNEMGFTNRETNLAALVAVGGNVNRAIERLLGA